MDSELVGRNVTISVVARNLSTGDSASASSPFTVTSRLVNGLAAVNPTRHPLVALFSGPACRGSQPHACPFHSYERAFRRNLGLDDDQALFRVALTNQHELLHRGYVSQYAVPDALRDSDTSRRSA